MSFEKKKIKSEKRVFECNVCFKVYKVEKWFQKHIESHAIEVATPPAVAVEHFEIPEDLGNSTESTLGGEYELLLAAECAAADSLDWGEDWCDEHEEVPCYFEEEDEDEERGRDQEIFGGKASTSAPEKKKKKAAIVKCNDCKSSFTTLEGYVKHRVTHGMQGVFVKTPTIEAVIKECPALGKAVLEEIEGSVLDHVISIEMSSICKQLKEHVLSEPMSLFFQKVCEGLYSAFKQKENFTLPSNLSSAFFVNVSRYILNANERALLLDIWSKFVFVTEETKDVLLSTFLINFSKKFLAFVLHVAVYGEGGEFKSLGSRYTTTDQPTDSVDFKQNMHYIGGSNIKSVLRRALREKNPCAEWCRIISTIKNFFLVSDFAEAPDHVLMKWTLLKDRGKLQKISNKALDFFVYLGKEVKPLERLDGSLLVDEVIDKVCNNPAILFRWDELKGSLCEGESFKLLHALISHFCVTWRSGIIGRRLDEMSLEKRSQKHGTGGVSFRARLAM